MYLTYAGLKPLQLPNGAFRATLSDTGEADVRFLYCACAISAILKDWSAVDKDRAVEYILQCLTYEGGIAVMPGKQNNNDLDSQKRILTAFYL
jgi:geranylgeranyl transferase type-1 subunit beta